ncbi:sulfatase [Rubellicoccus peritrichatus]|uniref:Sulfatase n=1 Tax=Rubellicoccus peritrichatus TaxID=3080537 RepID=A0AAQ3QRY9_9BACT|nr:sulfatase [Puniceicoccus sp. CR14]WOO39781.1 sulfatase [Puniceicoccus sp. CR14]
MNTSKAQIKQPNIILINCDDLGYGDLGCYGSTENETPVIDKLAEEGMRFTDFYMASPACSPSRGAMMTGCYPPRIGFGSFEGHWVLFPGQPVGLNPEEITIAKLLQQSGYATKLVGKWHCGDQKDFLPTKHGFDSYYGLPYSNDMGRQNEDDDYPPLPLLRDDEVIQQQPDQRSLTERYVEESVRFVRKNANQPFFLYLAHMHVHLPIYVPEHFLKESKNGRYGAAVACIDWATGVLLHELKQLGLEEDTLIIFTSDNGSRCQGEGGSNGKLRGTKGSTWEGGLRVPCIMRWPNKIPAGTTCTGITTAMDFYPTLAEIGGAEIPKDKVIDGVNILQVMNSGGTTESHRDTFFYYLTNNLEAIRYKNWKLHLRKNRREIKELYDLEADPGETQNIYEQHPLVVKELLIKMDSCREDIGDDSRNIKGKNIRPSGRVENPETLTHFDSDHPYIIAMYDLKDRG